ncbi:related to A.brasilense nifR3 protein [Cephalotrichum gorgonifer]|uniref:Related to A.brasilense nifR3 protein n=1 Tax=Cephalotrichum gorgonifer TaxID=2041049 RepID=A0AAE8MPL2_9PEZI|nr:related to A.brasilense nifR3 protein [Cephalotrichum gorgonifer]
MDSARSETLGEGVCPTLHPLKIFDAARASDRFVYTCAPMVRYGKLAFRQTVHEYGVDLSWTPMILSKEFNRSQVARDSDFTTSRNPNPTIVQFGANDPQEFSRSATLAVPFANGVDLNCGCPQSWACASSLGAALMDKRELVRDMVAEAREALRRDGWDRDRESKRGRSVSVKIRIQKDLRKTVDFINTVIGNPDEPLVDFITIHPRTRSTPSTTPINTEALALLASEFGGKIPLFLSGDVFAVSSLPIPSQTAEDDAPRPSNTNIAGLMAARGLLCNPALFADHPTCPWSAVESFMRNVARAPIPLRLVQYHLGEMCGPGMGAEKGALLDKKERMVLHGLESMLDVVDFMDEMRSLKTGRAGGLSRF